MEVIYTGCGKSPEMGGKCRMQEDVDATGISISAGPI